MEPDAILDQDDVPISAIELEPKTPQNTDRENFSEWSNEKASKRLDAILDEIRDKEVYTTQHIEKGYRNASRLLTELDYS